MITIIIPLYNSEKTILPLLESIDKQDYKNVDVMVVDDCSTDGSLEIVSDYKGSVPLEILKMPENSGPAAARNLGASKAKGDILFFLDSDLLLEDNALKNVHEFFKNPEAKTTAAPPPKPERSASKEATIVLLSLPGVISNI